MALETFRAMLPSLFSNFAEIHSAQLGVILSLLVLLAYNRGHELVAYGLLFVGVYLAFGSPEVAQGPIHRKPWYFLGGTYLTTAGGMLLSDYVGWRRKRADHATATDDEVARTYPAHCKQLVFRSVNDLLRALPLPGRGVELQAQVAVVAEDEECDRDRDHE